MRHYIIEWSADCNTDGIVDYGQILDGTFEDANQNGVPDCCDDGGSCEPCPGDITGGGQVNGVDLAAILGAWGTDGQGKFDCDINDDATVDAQDLAIVLGGWGNCP
jgi:ferredoxin